MVSPAQQAVIFGDADKVAINEMFRRYNKAFVDRDYVTLRKYVLAPFLVWIAGYPKSLESIDEIETVYRNLREPLEERNYDHTTILGTRIEPLAADCALINTNYRRHKKDGSPLEDGAAFYLVSKSTGRWKLLGWVPQDPRYFGKVYSWQPEN